MKSNVKYAKLNKFFVVISTNAQIDIESFLSQFVDYKPNKIIISLDGFDQESYQKYRIGGSFTKVIENLHKIRQWKIKHKSWFPLIEVQVLINRYNELYINEFKHIAKTTNATLKLKTMQIHDALGIKNFNPSNSKYSRYFKSGLSDHLSI